MVFDYAKTKKMVDATGLSEAAFAKLNGFPQTTLNSWLSGVRNCKLYIAILLADALHCELEEIWSGGYTDSEWLQASIKVISKMIQRREISIDELAGKCAIEANSLRKMLAGKLDMPDTVFDAVRYALGLFGLPAKCLYTIYCQHKENPRSLASLMHYAALNPALPVPDPDMQEKTLTPTEFIQQMNLRLFELGISKAVKRACLQELNGMKVLESTDKMKLAFIRRVLTLPRTEELWEVIEAIEEE